MMPPGSAPGGLSTQQMQMLAMHMNQLDQRVLALEQEVHRLASQAGNFPADMPKGGPAPAQLPAKHKKAAPQDPATK